MLTIDSSAILAMLFEEPESAACAATVGKAKARVISSANYVEAGTVLMGRAKFQERHEAMTDLDAFLAACHIEIAPITADLARMALKARLRYGAGFGTRGGLNFGNCFAYAVAKSHSAPLLFVGEDFAITDIESALRV
jgi:Uncharacterized protein conserved in bacteria